MHGRSFVAVIIAAAPPLVFAVSIPVAVSAEDVAAAEQPPASTGAPAVLPSPVASSPPGAANPPSPGVANSGPPPAGAAAQPAQGAPDPSTHNAAAPSAPIDSVVASIRRKLSDPSLRQSAAPEDVAALQSFYEVRSGPAVWMTPMGFSAKAQTAINEIGKADDWGLAAAAFDLPPAGDLPATANAQAVAEIKLGLAILKYARFARGGRANPAQLSALLDQKPTLKDPKSVLTEIAASPTPDAYLRSLHPKHEQFERLRQALLKARGEDDTGAKKPRNEPGIQRLLINMERWRWMPEDLGSVYVQDNVPEFMLYVVKNGKTIHSDKIVVGKLAYATPIFSADMQTIVFNPEWTVPETIVLENLLPSLRSGGWFGGGTSILREHGLQVKYNGRTVDPASIDWKSVNMANIAFVQAPGPTNVLGKLKFLYPNKHTVYMHDTIKRDLFKLTVRAEGHNCIRMSKPDQLAEVLLAEDKGWQSTQVQDLVATGNNTGVSLDHPIPVHTTYFTAVVDDEGKVASFADIYGLDRKVAPAVLGKSVAFAAMADDASADTAQPELASAPKRKAPKDTVAGSLQGMFGD
jgi:L,D-transpeptidase YcbB